MNHKLTNRRVDVGTLGTRLYLVEFDQFAGSVSTTDEVLPCS